MYALAKLAARIGRAKDMERVRALPVVLVAETATGAQAVVREESRLLIVHVRQNLEGRCPCTQGVRDRFCDHIAAAALAWLDRSGT